MQLRTIQEVRATHPSRDGDGVAIQRVHGMQHAGMDPVLMIDELRSDNRADFSGGFPPHPHRGMQTLTYMKQGGIVHEDSEGNRGEIRGGGAQWMSAGRGVIHSEMPTPDSTGFHGFQIWVNLAAAEKMSAPAYRDVPATELATIAADHFELSAIAGEWQLDEQTTRGPLQQLEHRVAIADLRLEPGATVNVAADVAENLLAYVYDGSLSQASIEIETQHLLVTSSGDTWQVTAGEAGASLLILRGEPLRELVAQYGPFVMNTMDEIEQAMADYQSGRFIELSEQRSAENHSAAGEQRSYG